MAEGFLGNKTCSIGWNSVAPAHNDAHIAMRYLHPRNDELHGLTRACMLLYKYHKNSIFFSLIPAFFSVPSRVATVYVSTPLQGNTVIRIHTEKCS